MANKETWKNATRGKVVVLKYDMRGNLIHELVHGGGAFTLSKEERLLNMDRAANENLDVFKNGTLVPVRLLDGDEEAAEIASNPNLITEDDMKSLFKAHWKTFEAKVAAIGNPLTLQRMLQLAEDEETGATIKQQKTIKARLDEVQPQPFVERQTLAGPRIGGEIRPQPSVTP